MQKAIKSIQKPPRSYDHRTSLADASKRIIRERFPALVDLSEAGTVIAVPRSELYVERRTDGYVEPELVIIVGTSHASATCALEVRRTIEAVRPENVVVELCRSRSSVMYRDAEKLNSGGGRSGYLSLSLSGEDFVETFRKTMELGGQSALLLRLLLVQISKNFANRMGLNESSMGGEFAAARMTAEEIGAQVVLGDRPIEVTLRRAWEKLTFRQQLDFVRMLWLASRDTQGNAALLDALRRDDDAVNSMLVALSEDFPELAESFVHERDLYLAWSLKRSKAVNGSKRVVGVIGKGHMRGVCYALTHDAGGGLRFRDLAGNRRESTRDVVAKFVLESGIFVALYALWSIYNY